MQERRSWSVSECRTEQIGGGVGEPADVLGRAGPN